MALTKASIENYAQYEQLVGGVETLFKSSAGVVQNYAANAYKTAGLSANEYMETVTSFSASLLQSLGGDTAAAAKYADTAITDMSDNANKMGTDMSMIQNAYQGFAKQNYTMLDNLKLGYGGTKEEMERLISDAEKLTGKDLDISSYADVVTAIHAVQTEMGITGTTALEASTTIQGSLSSLKSAWENVLTGVVDLNADLGTLISNLVDSAGTAMSNLLPAISNAVFGIGELIVKLAPQLINTIVGLLPKLIPVAVKAVTTITQALISNLPLIISTGLQLIISLAQGIVEALPDLIPTIVDVILEIVDILTSPESMAELLEAALQIVLALAKGLIESIPKLLEKAPEIIGNLFTALVESLPVLWDAGIQIIEMIGSAISGMFSSVVEWGKGVIDSIGEGIKSAWASVKDWGRQTINKLWDGIVEAWEGVKSWFSGVWDSLFGNLSANVNVGVNTQRGAPRAGGLDYVPYNDYPVRAHKGEAILTAAEAEAWRRGNNGGSGTIINQTINAVPQTAAEFADATLAAFQRARWLQA